MSLSKYFEDKDIISQLRSFFEINEQWKIDFQSFLADVIDYNEEYYAVTIKNRTFTIHKLLGIVEEVES